MSSGAPDLAVLPESQRVLWPSLSQVPPGFVLYGGTALALRLGHRQSVDFDFFTSRPFPPVALQAAIPFLQGGVVGQSEPNTLSVWVRPLPKERAVRISFFGGIGFPVIDRPDRPDPRGVVIASLRDLAGTKAKVINEMSAITYFEEGEARSIPELLKNKLRAAARGASPAPVSLPMFASIEASAAALGR